MSQTEIAFEPHDLTAAQNDYALFLPAISSFYAGYIGRERHAQGLDPGRLPVNLGGMESLNWLNSKQSLFPYRWSLYSAGHADLDTSRVTPKEDMIRNREPGSFLITDSGGFQIAKGVWPGRWADPTCPNAEKKRRAVLEWQCQVADYGLTMDIPTWTYLDKKASEACGIHSYDDAVRATQYNNEYWVNNRHGDTRILNVLQGSNHAEADHWYDLMKHYCDPRRYPDRHFNGWGMGGQNMCDVHLVLKRLVNLIHDGLLEKGVHDWMHFLGTSKLEWAVLLTAIQRAVRQYANPNFTISFDCASPFLATANGQLYHNITCENRSKWSYKMSPTVDDKQHASDQRWFGDAVRQLGVHPQFEDSPITKRIMLKDICVYAPGDKNKIGKEGKTSWDSFSYALLMSHNVWTHIESVQRGNRAYDQGIMPGMLVQEKFERVVFSDVVDKIFSLRDRRRSLDMIDSYSRFWEQIIGTRGVTGSRTINATTMFDELFGATDTVATDDELDQGKLDQLENDA